MRTAIAAIVGAIIGAFIIATTATPEVITEIQYRERLIVEQVATTIDIDRIRDVPAKSPIDDDLDRECAYAIQRQTDEPLMGIILYVDRYWHGDACAAYDHLVEHGWY